MPNSCKIRFLHVSLWLRPAGDHGSAAWASLRVPELLQVGPLNVHALRNHLPHRFFGCCAQLHLAGDCILLASPSISESSSLKRLSDHVEHLEAQRSSSGILAIARVVSTPLEVPIMYSPGAGLPPRSDPSFHMHANFPNNPETGRLFNRTNSPNVTLASLPRFLLHISRGVLPSCPIPPCSEERPNLPQTMARLDDPCESCFPKLPPHGCAKPSLPPPSRRRSFSCWSRRRCS